MIIFTLIFRAITFKIHDVCLKNKINKKENALHCLSLLRLTITDSRCLYFQSKGLSGALQSNHCRQRD